MRVCGGLRKITTEMRAYQTLKTNQVRGCGRLLAVLPRRKSDRAGQMPPNATGGRLLIAWNAVLSRKAIGPMP
jgi:hypothetical protein